MRLGYDYGIRFAWLASMVLPGSAAAQLVTNRPASEPVAAHTVGVDRGIGVVYFHSDFRPSGRRVPDSLAVFADTTPGAPQIGAFLRWEYQPGIHWGYGVAARDSLRPNLVEFGYEIDGLPFERLTGDRRWARLLLGFDHAGRMQRGWARLDSRLVGIELWRESLPTRDRLYLLDSVPPLLFDRPDGHPLPRRVPAGEESGFGVYPEEVRGDWLRVRIQEPDDHCGEPVAQPRITHAWIRYLDRAGRPRVWFHSRGC